MGIILIDYNGYFLENPPKSILDRLKLIKFFLKIIFIIVFLIFMEIGEHRARKD